MISNKGKQENLVKTIAELRSSLLIILNQSQEQDSDQDLNNLINDISNLKNSHEVLEKTKNLFQKKTNNIWPEHSNKTKKQFQNLISTIDIQSELNLSNDLKKKLLLLKDKIENNEIDYNNAINEYFKISNTITENFSIIRNTDKSIHKVSSTEQFKEGTQEILASDLVIASRNMAHSINNLINKIMIQDNENPVILEFSSEAKQLSQGRAKFFGGLDLLSRVTDYVMKMHFNEQEKYKQYFIDLQSRLETISLVIGIQNDNNEQLEKNEKNFHSDFKNNLTSLKNKTQDTTNIEDLKNSVFSNIQNLENSLAEFKQQQNSLRDKARVEIVSLKKKIDALTKEQEKLKQNIENKNKKILQDELTTIPNRTAYEIEIDQLYKEWKSNYENNFLTICIVDVDNFKKINDNYGHDIGDVILKETALRLRQIVGSKGFVARWGGEEFVVVYPDINLKESVVLTKKIRLYFEKYPIKIQNHAPIILTISGGVATFSEESDTPNIVFKRADNALYYSKNNGRNKISYYQKKP